MQTLWVNGESVVSDATTLLQLLQQRQLAALGVAVAVNGEVVRRVDWPARQLHQGDRLEIVSAAQGG